MENQCKKVGYDTKKEAKEMLREVSKTPLYLKGKLIKRARQYYKCSFCGKYHLTSHK